MAFPLGGDSAALLDYLDRFRHDPASVPADWRLHFMASEPAAASVATIRDAWRLHGYRVAQLDPLGARLPDVPELVAARQATAALDGTVDVTLGGLLLCLDAATLTERLAAIHAGTAAQETRHLDDAAARDWLVETFEAAIMMPVDAEEDRLALSAITDIDTCESFLHTRFPTKKRFGLEGAESFAVMLAALIEAAPDSGISEIVAGGMHRGRLSTLATIFGKPLDQWLAEIKGRDLTGGGTDFTGDVPYHLGHATEREVGGRLLRLSIAPHPSHLIVVAPVVTGLARARQRDAGRDAVLPLCLHTDAAFSGQGLVAELLQLADLEGYSVGGTVHIVIDNGIGFTTRPHEARTARTSTDMAKLTGVPVLHVNGNDPVAALRMAQLALGWRQRFHRDIVLRLVCLRRNGHNELDEPRFTAPDLYRQIDAQPSLRARFSGLVGARHPSLLDDIARRDTCLRADLERAYAGISQARPNHIHALQGVWSTGWDRMSAADEATLLAPVPTGVAPDRWPHLAERLCAVPAGLTPHPKVLAFLEARRAGLMQGGPVNFATAEALAFASLLDEGVNVRLSGQDSVRGTFTQRHLALFDTASGAQALPLAALACEGARFEAINSPLSEYGVLAYEYGHSLGDPDTLTIWEAQFGDFLNGAQIAVDQFIVSAEAKWGLRSGLVIALPHGLEGQGPDHSSGRIERILASCAAGNMIVAVPSTPASLFHLLRRQVRAPWRKPLFLLSPKSMLRAKAATSLLGEMETGTQVATLRRDGPMGEAAHRIVLCCGKIVHDLVAERTARGLAAHVGVIAVEQVYPLPLDELVTATRDCPDVVWCQEEARNQGAGGYVVEALRRATGRDIPVIARPAMAATAGGSIERHDAEQVELVARAFRGL
jgi:2-oxoglutarate dehydrogenase E1 component